MRRYGYLLLAGCFLLFKCNTDSSKDAGSDGSLPPRDNYIVLLDLGDRILANNEAQVPKDIELVKAIYSIFTARLTAKDTSQHYYSLRDKLKLLSAPNWVYANIDLAVEQPAKKALVAGKMEETLNFILPDIYKSVITGTTGTTYTGAAIWNYFNEHLAGDLDKYGKNTLFILTDGYMSLHNTAERPAQKNRFASCAQIINALKDSPNWQDQFTKEDYGLLPLTQKMPSNLQVVVMQVNPKQGWSGEDSLLTKIWDKWFTEMGVSNYQLIKDDSTQKVKSLLAKLMSTSIDTSATAEQWKQITQKDTSTAVTATLATAKIPVQGSEVPAAVTETKKISPKAVAKELPPAINEKVSPPTALPNAAAPVIEKKTAVTVPKTNSNTDVLPPDESDARLLINKKAAKSPQKKPVAKNEDDILQDDAAGNGFNTGIKKDNKKKKQ